VTTAQHPPLLIPRSLDEPEAGLSNEQGRAIVNAILSMLPGTAILVVEHDVETVFQVSESVVVLDHGSVIARGSPPDVRDNPEVQEAYLGIGLDGVGAQENDG
jgi:ABC-type branched-subunit amino acid transport system ATPase component